MIQRIFIRDFAVIDEMDLTFGPEMNLLTGETGSGKSIIVDAMAVALGERADPNDIRSGCDKALVETVLDASDSPRALEILEESGLLPEDGCIVVSREISGSGKSQCRINGRPATVSLVKAITDHLVDTHGQHEHQFLLNPERHLAVVDAWRGDEAIPLRTQVAEDYAKLRALKSELAQLRNDERERIRSVDLYQFQIKEIGDAKLTPDEEEELFADRIRLANAEKLHAAAGSAFEAISDRASGASAIEALSEAVSALQGAADIDSELANILEAAQSAFYQVEDVSRALRSYKDAVEFNPDRLEIVEERLNLISSLKRKYGESIEEIVRYGADLERRLEALLHSEERSTDLGLGIERCEAEVLDEAQRLSEIRRLGAESFSKAVELELAGLGMPNGVFQVACEPQQLDSSGVDRVEFLISANLGEPARPLAKIASGGEMSRVMLAIKSAMSAADSMPTLVFDEIDVGVGGRTAEVIGLKLKSLASRSQVLCITHLPQIACLPGEHFYIEKEACDGRTVVRVRKLDSEQRVQELARMVGGLSPSETAVQHAREMLMGRTEQS